MKADTLRLLAALVLLALAAPLAAEQAVAVYAGGGRAFNHGDVFEGGLEWQFQPLVWELRPIFGVLGSRESMRYAYAGLRREFWIGRLLLAPFTGAGHYEREEGPNLGGAFQFRTGLEVGMRLRDGWRVGASLYHLSNAGTERPNPGTEAVVLNLSRVVVR